MSAGIWLPEYSKYPFRLLPGRLRRFVVRGLSTIFPTLFGCQVVIRAERAEPSVSSTFH
jgi:hypothetical protein